jgi:hypothetical protein
VALTELEERCVVPFYLQMMGLNALGYPVPFTRLRDVGRPTTNDEVIELLGGLWRPRVMGAWFAAGRTEPDVIEAVLASLATSAGSSTAPPLATVAILGSGTGAMESMRTYLEADLAHRRGSAGFIAAALEHVGAAPEGIVIQGPRPRSGTRNALRRTIDRPARIVKLDYIRPRRTLGGRRARSESRITARATLFVRAWPVTWHQDAAGRLAWANPTGSNPPTASAVTAPR